MGIKLLFFRIIICFVRYKLRCETKLGFPDVSSDSRPNFLNSPWSLAWIITWVLNRIFQSPEKLLVPNSTVWHFADNQNPHENWPILSCFKFRHTLPRHMWARLQDMFRMMTSYWFIMTSYIVLINVNIVIACRTVSYRLANKFRMRMPCMTIRSGCEWKKKFEK